MHAQSLHCVQLFATLWIVAYQAPLFMGFSRQEYWSGLLCPPPGDLPNPGIQPTSPAAPALQADSLPLIHQDSERRKRYVVLDSYGATFWNDNIKFPWLNKRV